MRKKSTLNFDRKISANWTVCIGAEATKYTEFQRDLWVNKVAAIEAFLSNLKSNPVSKARVIGLKHICFSKTINCIEVQEHPFRH